MKKVCFIIAILMATVLVLYYAFPKAQNDETLQTFHTSLGQPKSLDPAYATDYASCVMILSLFDTLYQYDYTARPYRVIPSMLKDTPIISADQCTWNFTLRDDLFFNPDSCFGNQNPMPVKARDVVFSLLRLADARVASPGYSLLRGKIKGLEDFRLATTHCEENDFAPYHHGCEGLFALNDSQFCIKLTAPEPRLPYYLTMSYTAILSEIAVRSYGQTIRDHAVGSGPFLLADYQKNYRMKLLRNPHYRTQYLNDTIRSLPYLDKIICYLVQDPQPGWLMFLNGELDVSVVVQDQMDIVGNGTLPEALRSRGIQLLSAPELQMNYIGFSFTEPRLARNLNLRRAITSAYNLEKRRIYFNGLVDSCTGPIPNGIDGYSPTMQTLPYNLEAARNYLTLAGYPNGIDPTTQAPLTLTFDLPETSSAARQIAEMMVDDMAQIGIKIVPMLNSKPKFLEKNRAGQMQLFRFNWIFDYPDAENVFQLFYAPNAGGCNRVFYNNPAFDSAFRFATQLPNTPERTRQYTQLSRELAQDCPWIFESQSRSFRLIHAWVDNYHVHDFAFDRWKYLKVDPQKRKSMRATFSPIPIHSFSQSKP